ncbi:MAG: hypothetical protein KAY37_07340, partial [Phycisphaerae bacterium]|nr:hypothetical protein [Phycisphaerae bacterium]
LPDGASVTFSVNDAPPPFTTVMTIDNLDGAAAGEYELRITGNTAGGMQRQTVARLSIIRNLPAPVTLRSPANGECDVHCMSLLIWEAASTATTYELEVATDSGFADVVHAVTVSRTRHRVDPPLDALTSYYWRVRAVNDCGAGPYSPVFGFTTPAWTGSVLRVPAEQTTIQAAIDAAQDGDVVLVADGTYKGTGNRDLHVDGKAITVCSTGGPELCVIACENAGVGFILASGETAATVVDGFTIRAGNCFYSGGGILIAGSSPTISDCHILDNWARLDGGGIYCTDGNPLIVDCTFSGNNVRYGGGGLFCDNDSDVTLIGCTFSRNIAGYYAGGGVASYDGALTITDSTIAENRINGGHNYSGGGGLCCSNTTLVLTNCRVLGNTAGSTGYHGCGGGIMCNNGNAVVTACTFSLNQARSGGGGIALSGTDSASIADCTITGNRASYGGGTYCRGAGTTNVVNCAITGNMAYYSGGGVYCEDTVFVNCTIADNATMSPFGGGVYCHCDGVYSELVNCIVWDNNPDGLFADGDDLIVRYCDLQGGWPGLGNIDADPFFVAAGHWEDPATPSDPWDDVWVAGDYHLTAESPCVNRGDNEAPGLPAQDLDGQPRIQMCRVDMGVDETPHIGSDCNENGVADACDVEQGTSPDCNDNLVPDECDVASGSSPDTNANGVPDECEVCPGDSNCDGHVDWRDIEYFLAALVSEHEWECRFSETPPCPYLNNDVNADGAVTWKDVDPLVVLMNTTCPRGRR